MKKFLALILALVLALSCCTALADTFTYEDLFSVEFPDDWGYQAGEETEEENYWYVGFFGGPGDTDLNFDVRIYYEEDYADFRLFDLAIEDAEFSEYADMLEQWYVKKNVEYSGVIYTTENNIPFVVLQGSDDYGPLILADTMSNGYEFLFQFYAYADSNYDTCRELTEEDIILIRQILGSFGPAK